MPKSKVVQKTGAASISKVSLPREKVVRERLVEVKNGIELGDVELSELLSEAYHKEFYIGWGFPTFEEYCKGELDVNYRKAMHFVEIWDKVKSLDLPRARVAKLGWTKMRDLAGVITKKNAEALLKKAEGMNTRDLAEHCKTMRRTGGLRHRDEPETREFKCRLGEAEYKIVEDAINEAKKMVSTDSLAVAIESICSEWLTLKEAHPEVVALEDFITYLEKMYPVKISFKTVQKKKVSESAKAAQEALAEVEGKSKGKKSKKAKQKEEDTDPDDLDGLSDSSDSSDMDINKLIGIDE